MADPVSLNSKMNMWWCESLNVHFFRNFTDPFNDLHLSTLKAGEKFNFFGFVASYTNKAYTGTPKFTIGGHVVSSDVIFQAYLDKKDENAVATQDYLSSIFR